MERFYTEEMRITPVRDSKGEIVSYIAIKQDVTERRAAEEAQAAFWPRLWKAPRTPSSPTRPRGSSCTWNRGAEAIFGYSAARGDREARVHAGGAGTAARPARISPNRYCRATPSPNTRVVCLRKDGRRIHVSVTASPIRNSAGEVAAISAILRDISERREAEQARALLASIVESSDDAIIGRRLWMEPSSAGTGALKRCSVTRARKSSERTSAMLAPPGRRDEVTPVPRRPSGRGAPSALSTRSCQGKDGRRIDVSLSISPIRNPAGEVVGASGYRPRYRQALAGRAEAAGKRGAIPRGLRARAVRHVRERAGRALPPGECGVLPDAGIFRTGTAGHSLGGADPPRRSGDLPAEAWSSCRTDPGGCVEAERRYLHRNGSVVWARVQGLAGARRQRQPAVFRGPRGRHHRAQAGRGGAARKRRALPHHGRQLPDA